MSKPITVVFEGNPAGAVNAFDKVGAASKGMAQQVDRSTDSHKLLSARVGETEGRFMGMADVLDGVGTAFGLPIDGAINMARAAGDVTGGLSNLSGIIPSVMTKFPQLAGAMTLVSAHPIMTAFLVGGAIIGGLILLEKKFGVVSGAVEGMGNAFMWAYDHGVKPAVNFILGGAERMLNGLGRVASIGGNFNPLSAMSGLANVRLPRLDVGGTILQTGIAVVHRGEVVSPAAGSPSRSAGEAPITVIVQGNVVSEVELVDAIHAGLLRKQGRTGSLGIKAA